MPIYEFECENCKEVMECLVTSKEDDKSCPSCGSTALKKLVSTGSFKINGYSEANGYSCSTKG